jgi:hypothetical protein
VEAEYLFARAFEELDQRLAEGTLYAGLRCAAILRQMFADQHTLIAQAKRGYSTKLTFSVLHPRPVDYAALGISPPDLMVMGDQLENTPAPLIRSNLNLDQFLGFKVANYQGAAFSVRALIKYLADACGGVHLGAPKGDQEVLRELDRVLVEMGVESLRPSAGTIRGIAKVAVDGLRPLYEAIIAKHEPQRRVLSVMGTVRGNLPAEFPGRRGSLMGNLLCTPLDVGSCGAIPPATFYQWLEVVQSADEFEKLTKALGYDTPNDFSRLARTRSRRNCRRTSSSQRAAPTMRSQERLFFRAHLRRQTWSSSSWNRTASCSLRCGGSTSTRPSTFGSADWRRP